MTVCAIAHRHCSIVHNPVPGILDHANCHGSSRCDVRSCFCIAGRQSGRTDVMMHCGTTSASQSTVTYDAAVISHTTSRLIEMLTVVVIPRSCPSIFDSASSPGRVSLSRISDRASCRSSRLVRFDHGDERWSAVRGKSINANTHGLLKDRYAYNIPDRVCSRVL